MAAAAAQQEKKEKQDFLILFSLPSLLCNLEVPRDQALFFFFPKETRHTGYSLQTHKNMADLEQVSEIR